ncbi:hypothetical protein [Arcobacter sp. F2176]|uniref:hypothetical protein n=1 Tax=Arcobacter sp. F2176 TaxID=2044511 RepID=UPI00100C32EB|nr:hypothetical protein [Arcobacter sp. F2176]RXJ80205.1 hypothetical protein CRU95_12045 [Arcobacter sp. F2176]
MMERNGILLAGKRILLTIIIGLLCSLSLSADYELTITNNDGTETKECIKSYSFSNNLESIAKQNGVGQDIYSKEETLTNKVYLGKPVYRKVYTFGDYTVPQDSVGVTKYTDVISENIDRIVHLDYKVYVDDALSSEVNSRYAIYGNSVTTATWAGFSKSSKKAYIFLRNQMPNTSAWNITDSRLTVEYTKTTDSVSTSQNKFKSYFHYVLSSNNEDEVITLNLKDIGVRFKEGYFYDSSTNSCTKN